MACVHTNLITMSERHSGSAPQEVKLHRKKKKGQICCLSQMHRCCNIHANICTLKTSQNSSSNKEIKEQTDKQRRMRRFRQCGSSLAEASLTQPSRRSSHFCLSQKHDKRVCRRNSLPPTRCLSREKRKIIYCYSN